MDCSGSKGAASDFGGKTQPTDCIEEEDEVRERPPGRDPVRDGVGDIRPLRDSAKGEVKGACQKKNDSCQLATI